MVNDLSLIITKNIDKYTVYVIHKDIMNLIGKFLISFFVYHYLIQEVLQSDFYITDMNVCGNIFVNLHIN